MGGQLRLLAWLEVGRLTVLKSTTDAPGTRLPIICHAAVADGPGSVCHLSEECTAGHDGRSKTHATMCEIMPV